jgi:hypothetical protein
MIHSSLCCSAGDGQNPLGVAQMRPNSSGVNVLSAQKTRSVYSRRSGSSGSL